MTLNCLFCGNTGNEQHRWCWFWCKIKNLLEWVDGTLISAFTSLSFDKWGGKPTHTKGAPAPVSSCSKMSPGNRVKQFQCLCHGGHHWNVSVCLWVGGCCHGVDLHVLHIDGIKSLISMYHRTKHHRLQQNKRTVQYFYSTLITTSLHFQGKYHLLYLLPFTTMILQILFLARHP